MKPLILLALLATTIPAMAQQPELSDEAKRDILIRAYRANGNSMTRYGSIDLKEIVDGRLIDPRDVSAPLAKSDKSAPQRKR